MLGGGGLNRVRSAVIVHCTRRLLRALVMVVTGATIWASIALAEDLDEAGIVALSRAKLGDEVLIAQIETHPCNYNLSTEGLARFKKAGVSNAVIAALIRHCSARNQRLSETLNLRRDVVMLHGSQGWLLTLTPATIAAGHAGGNGSFLFPARSRLTLPGETSTNLAGSAMPQFVIRLQVFGSENQSFTALASNTDVVAARYRLARFDVGSGRRTLKVDSMNPLGAVAGLDARDMIPLHAVPYVDATFRLEPVRALAPGEYALIDVGRGPSYQVYDFSVR